MRMKKISMRMKILSSFLIVLTLTLILNVFLSSNEPIKKRGQTTTIQLPPGSPQLCCDCTITKDTDCSCIIEN